MPNKVMEERKKKVSDLPAAVKLPTLHAKTHFLRFLLSFPISSYRITILNHRWPRVIDEIRNCSGHIYTWRKNLLPNVTFFINFRPTVAPLFTYAKNEIPPYSLALFLKSKQKIETWLSNPPFFSPPRTYCFDSSGRLADTLPPSFFDVIAKSWSEHCVKQTDRPENWR